MESFRQQRFSDHKKTLKLSLLLSITLALKIECTLYIYRYKLCPKKKSLENEELHLLAETCWAGLLINLWLYSWISCAVRKESFLTVHSHSFMAGLFLSWKYINSDRQCQLQNIFKLVCFPCFFHAVARDRSSQSVYMSTDPRQEQR